MSKKNKKDKGIDRVVEWDDDKHNSNKIMEYLMTYGWAILAGVIAIITLVYLGAFDDLLSIKPKFTIYKEECRNESFNIGKKLIKQELRNCTVIRAWDSDGDIDFEDCYKDNTYFNYSEEYPCESLKCEFNLPNPSGYSYYTPRFVEVISNESILVEQWEDMKEVKEVCTKVEVDEMVLISRRAVCRLNNESSTEDVFSTMTACLSVMSKKDLTIEWLDENCLAWELYSSEDNVICQKEINPDECNKRDYDKILTYKCGGNYYVKNE